MANRLLLNAVVQGAGGTYVMAAQPDGNAYVDVFNAHELVAMLNVSATPTGVPTLNVYMQYSADGGVTWNDFISFTQVTTTASIQFASVSGYITGGVAPTAQKDATLAAGTVNQGPFGQLIRAKYVIVAGTGSYTITLSLDAKG